jgi:hypothetical protein
MDDPAGALAHHAAALEAATISGEAGALALGLEGAAARFFVGGRADFAVVVLGAASRLWNASADPGGASHRADVAALTDRVRDQLGADAFVAAYKRGTRMGRAEVLDAARAMSGVVTSAPPQRAPSS